MDVAFDNWKQNSMSVTPDDADNLPKYEIKCHSMRQKMVFSSEGEEFATSNMHFYKSSFDAIVREQPLHVTSDKFWKVQRSYDSPAYGQKLTWKSSSSFTKLDFICLDENAMPVAKFTTKNGWKKVGRIEFDGDHTPDNRQREEVVVVGMTLAYQIIQGIIAGSSASSASAAASVSVVA